MKIQLHTAIAVCVLALAFCLTTTVASASTYPPSGSEAITPQAPAWKFSDSNGHGGIQVNYKKNPYVINTGFTLNPRWVATCGGAHTLNENETLTRTKARAPLFHDHHAAEPCDYTAHPSAKGPLGAYQLKVQDTWKIYVQGGTGTAKLMAQANFSITVI